MSLFSAIGSYEDAWKAIIMPFRQEYSLYDLGLTEFNARDNRIKRTDFRLLNKRGQVIECSFYQHVNITTPVPCVVYLHGNGCSRIEALQYLDIVLSQPVSFFCFDFSGCGKSGGEFTSVGWHEQEDLECVIQYLCNTGKVTKVAVWGRSMGAVTSILYAQKDPRIDCFILDSPFSNFKQLVKELAKQKASIPGFLVSGAFNIIRKTILKKANFDIDALRPIKYVDKIKVPALFGSAKDDTFVSPQHTKDLYMAYGGPKQLMMFEGDHNSQRPFNWMLLVQKFIKVHLLGEKDESQNTTTSFKQPFNPVEKTAQPTTETTQTQSIETKPLKKSSPPRQQPPKLNLNNSNMTFTWLDHSASSPNLTIRNPSDKTTQEPSDKENTNTAKPAKSGKRLQNLFADSKKENILVKPPQIFSQNLTPKSALVKGDAINKHIIVDKSPTLRGHSKPLKFGSKENSAPVEKKHEEKLTKNTSSINLSTNHPSISIFGPKQKEIHSENLIGSPFKEVRIPRSDISLNEIPTSRLNNASNIQVDLTPIPLHKANSSPVKNSTKNLDISNLSIPLSNLPSSKSRERRNLALTPTMLPMPARQIDSQRDPKRIFDKGSKTSKNATMTTRSPTSKSFTIDMKNLKAASKENTSPMQNQKTLLLQVKLNSDIPIINPTDKRPNNNLTYITNSLNNMAMDSRRASEATVRSYEGVLGENSKKNVGLSGFGNESRGYRDNTKIPMNLIDNAALKIQSDLPPKSSQREVRKVHEIVK